MVDFLRSKYLHAIFLWFKEKWSPNNECWLKLTKRRSKVQLLMCFNFGPMKTIFPKTVSQWEFDYVLFKNLPRIIAACDFSPSSFKLKIGILPPLKNKYPNLKITFHIKPKFFSWVKLLQNLLLTKYLMSVAAVLRNSYTPNETLFISVYLFNYYFVIYEIYSKLYLWFQVNEQNWRFQFSKEFQGSPPEVFFGKWVLRICRKFTGENPCWSLISVNLLHIFRVLLYKNISEGLLLDIKVKESLW